MTQSTTPEPIKKEIADVQAALKGNEAQVDMEIHKEIADAIVALKANKEELTNEAVLDAIYEITVDKNEQEFLAKTLGLDWEKLKDKIQDNAEKGKKFEYAEVTKEIKEELVKLGDKVEDEKPKEKEPSATGTEVPEALKVKKEESDELLEKGIYLYSDYKTFKKQVLDDLIAIDALQKKEKGEEGTKDKSADFLKNMDAPDALKNRLSKMFPEEFKKGDWEAIENKLGKSEFQTEWENKHEGHKYEIADPKKGNLDFQKNIDSIPRYEYDKVEGEDGEKKLEYSENAKEYVDALEAGFRGSYEDYRDLMPKSTMEGWTDKGKKLMNVLGNFLEKILGPFRKYFDENGFFGKLLNSLGTKGKEKEIKALNEKNHAGFFGIKEVGDKIDSVAPKVDSEKEKSKENIDKILIEKNCKISNTEEITSKASATNVKKLEKIVTENAGQETALAVAMTPSKNGGKEISFESILLLNELTEKDRVDLKFRAKAGDATILEVYGKKKDGKELPISLTDYEIFQTVVEKKEVKLEKVPDLKVSGVEKNPVGYNQTVDEFYYDNEGLQEVSGKKVEMRNALTSETVREVLEKIDADDKLAEEIKKEAGDLPLEVLQKIAKTDGVEIAKNGVFDTGNPFWSGDIKAKFKGSEKWYDFDTFEELGEKIDEFEKEKESKKEIVYSAEDSAKITELAKEMKIPAKDLKDILDVKKEDYYLFGNKEAGIGLDISLKTGFIMDAELFRVWINNSENGQNFMKDNTKKTLREYLELPPKEKKEEPVKAEPSVDAKETPKKEQGKTAADIGNDLFKEPTA